MKSAVIAISPESVEQAGFDAFCEALGSFQSRGLFEKVWILSLTHPSMFLLPYSWYEEMKGTITEDLRRELHDRFKNRVVYEDIEVKELGTSSKSGLVTALSKRARQLGADVLVVMGSGRSRFLSLLTQSHVEAAVTTATLPVMVIKQSIDPTELRGDVRIVIRVDPLKKLSNRQLEWIAGAAKLASAKVDLVYHGSDSIRGSYSISTNPLSLFERRLQQMTITLGELGVAACAVRLSGNQDTEAALAEYADRHNAWFIIDVEAAGRAGKRSLIRSRPPTVLGVSHRPVLSLKAE